MSTESNGVGEADASAKAEGKDGRGTKSERKAAKLAEKKAEKLAMRQKDGGGEDTPS